MSKQLFNVNVTSKAVTGYVFVNRDYHNQNNAEVREVLREVRAGKHFCGDTTDTETGIVVHHFQTQGGDIQTTVTVTPVVE